MRSIGFVITSMGLSLSLLVSSVHTIAADNLTALKSNPKPSYQVESRTISGANDPVENQTIYRSEEEVNQFIIEFKQLPVLNKKQQLHAALKRAGKLSTTARVAQINNAVQRYQSALRQSQRQFIDQIKVSGAIEKVIRSNYKLHNSIVVQGDRQRIKALKHKADVKRIRPVTKVSKYLEESVSIINADNAWQFTGANGSALTGEGMLVAVIDTGVDYRHPDLGGCLGMSCKVVGGYDFVEDDADPMDVDGHGTHVAGIVAANGKIKGVAPDAKLLAVRVLDDNGWGTDADIIAGIEYAVDPDDDPATDDGADVINLSLGGAGDYQSPMSTVTNNAVDAGVVVVAAAGNSSHYGDIAFHSPASALNIITVGSSDKSDGISSFSSKGGGAAYQQLKPEVVAPGSDIYSLIPNESYAVFNGTSMASPHVAGAAALILQKYPDETPAQVKARLISGAKDLGADAYAQGYGRIDVEKSLQQGLQLADATLAMGRVDRDASSISYTGVITLTNNSNENVTLNVILPTDFPKQISLNSDIEQLTVPANDSASVTITMDISDVDSLAVPDNTAATYFSKVLLQNDNTSFKVPVTVERGYRLTISHDNPSYIDVSVDGYDGRNYYWGLISAGETKTFFLSETSVVIRAKHNLTAEDVNHLELPERNGEMALIIDGYENRFIEVKDDVSVHFAIANLNQVVGLGSATDKAGNDILSQALTAQRVLKTKIEYKKDNYSLTTTYINGRYFNSELPEDRVAHFMLVGALSDEVDTKLYEVYRIPELQGENSDAFVFKTFDLAGETHSPYSYVESESPYLEFTHLQQPETTKFAVDVKSSFSPPRHNLMTNKERITLTKAIDKDTDEGVILYLGNRDNQYDALSFVPVSSSSELNFSNEGIVSGLGSELENASQYDFHSNGLFVAKPFEVFNGILQLQGKHFSNLTEQGFHSAIDAEYRVFCDSDNALETGAFDVSNHLNVSVRNCSELTMEISWHSYLLGKRYANSAHYQFKGSSLADIAGLSMAIKEDDSWNSDRNVSGDSNHIFIGRSENNQGLTLDKLELKLGEGEWQKLAFSSTEEHGFFYSAELPKVTGNIVASLKISYLGRNSFVTQEVNGAFVFGEALSNGSIDTDGDGIPDDIEQQLGLNPNDSSDANLDLDNDGLTNIEEYILGTSLDNNDTDGDGLSDYKEVKELGTNPLIAKIGIIDFDGDGISDKAVLRPSSQYWYVANSSGEDTLTGNSDGISRKKFGAQAGDIPVPADYDGDGITDVAVRRPSNQMWYILNSSGVDLVTGYRDGITRKYFGDQVDDIPVPADYDGDGKADIAVRRPGTYLWSILNSSGIDDVTGHTDGITRKQFGKHIDDIPVAADYDGDGKADIAVRRPSTQYWYILNSSGLDSITGFDDGITRKRFGIQMDDIAVPADYDGDGKTDLAVFRASTQTWYILNSSNIDSVTGYLDGVTRKQFGKRVNDLPVPADYDGDGKVDIAIREPSSFYWHIMNSSGVDTVTNHLDGITRKVFGKSAGDIPLASPIQLRMDMLN